MPKLKTQRAEVSHKQTKLYISCIKLFMKNKLLLFLFIISSISVNILGHDTDDEKSSVVFVPENVMQEVVSRILIYQFKPRTQEKIIFISEKGIKQAWLPTIQNVEFQLLTDEEIEDSGKDVYFFTEIKISKRTYEIGLAYGDPDCDYIGNTWNFRFSKSKVRLWRLDGEFGGGCGGGVSGSFGEFSTPGELNTFPNELKDYKFFDTGKLKGLKLTISTKEEVKNSLGENCESSCDYNSEWKVRFSYFGSFSYERTVDNKKTKFVAKDELVDKLYSITLIPKSTILFNNVVFPSPFKKDNVYTAAHDGKGGGTNSSTDIYKDRYGLEYNILEKISLTTIKDLKWLKGELRSIEYTIPKKLEETMFVEEK